MILMICDLFLSQNYAICLVLYIDVWGLPCPTLTRVRIFYFLISGYYMNDKLTEVKCSVANSEYNSVSSKKVADEELFMRNKLPSVKCEENVNKRHHLGEADMFNSLLLKHESQPLNRKSAKNLSILPCPKRPRTDLPEHSLKACGSDASHEITKNAGIDIISCNSAGNKDL